MYRRSRIQVLLSGVLVALLAAVLGWASPAQAEPSVIYEKVFGPSSNDKSSVGISCRHYWIIGGGAVISGDTTGEVSLTSFSRLEHRYPYDSSSSFNASAREDGDGFGGSWSLTVRAICKPGIDVQMVRASGSAGTQSHATAKCPANRVAIGGAVSGGLLTLLLPMRTFLGTYEVRGVVTEDPTQPGAVQAEVVAFCVHPLPGFEIVEYTLYSNSSSVGQAKAGCSPGKHLYGSGFRIGEWSGHRQPLLQAVLVESRSVTVQVREPRGGTDADWSVRAYAVCADA